MGYNIILEDEVVMKNITPNYLTLILPTLHEP